MTGLSIGIWTALIAMFSLETTSTRPAPTPAGELARGFLYKTVEVDGQTHPYTVYVPPEYAGEKAWPVILFLHGSGERGDDGLRQTEVGIGRAIRLHRERIPAIVVMPQCPERAVWWTKDTAEIVLACINATAQAYRLDPERVYLTGLSLGGGGCWYFAALISPRLAAVAPICALSDEKMGLEPLTDKLTDVPIWAFHGSADARVDVADSRDMVRRIRAAGGDARLTEYPGANHFIWDRVYDDPEFWRWLLAQRRPQQRNADVADAAEPSPATD